VRTTTSLGGDIVPNMNEARRFFRIARYPIPLGILSSMIVYHKAKTRANKSPDTCSITVPRATFYHTPTERALQKERQVLEVNSSVAGVPVDLPTFLAHVSNDHPL